AATWKMARKRVKRERPEVWDILEGVVREHPIMLNRAPTLHRLGIQAFEPVLVEGKAIQLHPLVCAAFNADFDGDQMAVHVPLSLEAQLEARVLMMSTNNILSPANGKPIIVPSQDIVLGIYYLTMEVATGPGAGMAFADVAEIEMALESGTINLHSKIRARYKTVDDNNEPVTLLLETTAGRMLIANILPRHPLVPFSLVNRLLTKKEISQVIEEIYRHCGQKDTVVFADKLMQLGFRHACLAGISFGKDDMVVPDSKEKLVDETSDLVKEYEQQYQDGLITQGEKYNKVVDAWAQCTDKVADEMMNMISSMGQEDGNINSIWMMAHSGARGSAAQMKQLAGMRGLMAKPSGEIIETPIISNFKEGLSVLEYFNSTHGARKGLADTALKTANSGYLTRRLVDVAQDCTIVEHDCATENGITIKEVIEGGDVVSSLTERVLGRTASVDVIDPVSNNVLVTGGTMIQEAEAEILEQAGIQSLLIRSVLTCESQAGVCGKCYGRDLGRGTTVNVGEAIGVIAAQSIGEPGTQLTMRTFHIGGTAQVANQSSIEASYDARVHIENRDALTDSTGRLVAMGRAMELLLIDANDRERARYRIPYGARLLVDEGDQAAKGDKLAEWDPYTRPIMTERDGLVNYRDLVEGMTMREETDEATGISYWVVVDHRGGKKDSELRPRITLRDGKGEVVTLPNDMEARYFLPPDAILSVEDGSQVHAGDVLARIPMASARTRDITGGLPRGAELFEARRPKDHAIIAESDGYVEFGRDYKTKRRIIVRGEDESVESTEYLVPKGRHITVQEGDFIRKGEYLLDGNPAPHDILKVQGIEALAAYLVSEIQEVYRLQGVRINDKHIEVIVRQMLQKVEIEDGGETTFLKGEQVDRVELDEVNARDIAEGRTPATASPVLLGITKASLQTHSFVSAASFQETTRVLTEAAVVGKADDLIGLKENVIVGRLIPAGTGAQQMQFRQIAKQRDAEIQDAQAAALPDAEEVEAAAGDD
ncbi:MAG: DNA-directed RNA polymerase subunit beta', partial [Alphaproteobacteria bacterium]|nr:DNA-directed RNA polymerase subunit beta' [Alphaproteobacteria bacterium]